MTKGFYILEPHFLPSFKIVYYKCRPLTKVYIQLRPLTLSMFKMFSSCASCHGSSINNNNNQTDTTY